MFATDALFSRAPLDLDCGERLGQWEASTHAGLFVVQPGLYWGAKRPKTRGIPSESFFAEHVPTFEAAWDEWLAEYRSRDWGPNRAPRLPPEVAVPMRLFVGLKLAHAWNRPELAGRWMQIGNTGEPERDRDAKGKRFTFLWQGKRSLAGFVREGEAIRTLPCDGSPDLLSLPHKGNMELIAQLDLQRRAYDEQPDHLDLSPPWD